MKTFSMILATSALLLSATLPAFAETAPTVNKTWVSSTGSDSGSCQLVAPCKTFAYAIGQTNAGGEIDVRDSGAYGPFTIAKAISIVADGVVASVGVGSNHAGITIAANAGDQVSISGLVVNTHDKTQGVDVLVTCDCRIAIDHSALQGAQVGIDVIGKAFVMLTNTFVSGNIAGVYNALGPGASSVNIGSDVITLNQYGVEGYVNSYGDNKISGSTSCDTCNAAITKIANQ